MSPADVAARLGITSRQAECIAAMINHGGCFKASAAASGINANTLHSHLRNVRRVLGMRQTASVLLLYDRVQHGASNAVAREGLMR